MEIGRIALVILPAVVRVGLMALVHPVITPGLGQDGSCCNGAIQSVSADDTGVRYAQVGLETIAVDQQMLRMMVQLGHRAMHGQDGGLQNIDLVDLLN